MLTGNRESQDVGGRTLRAQPLDCQSGHRGHCSRKLQCGRHCGYPRWLQLGQSRVIGWKKTGGQRTDVILVLPLQADLQVVILVDQVKEPLQEVVALLLCHAIDISHMASNREDTLPPSDRVGAHDGVDCLELKSDVLRGATGLVVELEPAFLSDFLEVRLGEGPSQPLQEILVWFANAIVDLIARGPECV